MLHFPDSSVIIILKTKAAGRAAGHGTVTGAVSIASGCQTDAGRWSYVCVVIIAAFTAHCLAALLMRRKKLTGLQFVMFLVCFLVVDSMQIILVELYLMAGQVKRYLGAEAVGRSDHQRVSVLHHRADHKKVRLSVCRNGMRPRVRRVPEQRDDGEGEGEVIIDQGFPVVENFYSGSLADTPLDLCAEKAHLVTDKEQKAIDWPDLDAKTIRKVKKRSIRDASI